MLYGVLRRVSPLTEKGTMKKEKNQEIVVYLQTAYTSARRRFADEVAIFSSSSSGVTPGGHRTTASFLTPENDRPGSSRAAASIRQ